MDMGVELRITLSALIAGLRGRKDSSNKVNEVN